MDLELANFWANYLMAVWDPKREKMIREKLVLDFESDRKHHKLFDMKLESRKK